ncbi:MAG: SDR family oxidoreductase [Oscillospiraceae bacterium]|nr:SDR family oxidoreductase [Oscillospiraceae bacterium]
MLSKTVIITGASKGIGAATAKVFAEHNYRVVMTYRQDNDSAQRICESLISQGKESSLFRYDSGSSDDAKALVEFAIKRYNQIDVLVNNAAISLNRLVTESTDSDWQEVIDSNLSGVFYLSRETAKHMIKHKTGSIINLSSVYGIVGGSTETIYSASKAGLIGFSKALAKELAPSNITVNCVAPGVIDTSMNSYLSELERAQLKEQIPLGRFGEPDEVAEAIYFLAEHRYITGQVLVVDGGMT